MGGKTLPLVAILAMLISVSVGSEGVTASKKELVAENNKLRKDIERSNRSLDNAFAMQELAEKQCEDLKKQLAAEKAPKKSAKKTKAEAQKMAAEALARKNKAAEVKQTAEKLEAEKRKKAT